MSNGQDEENDEIRKVAEVNCITKASDSRKQKYLEKTVMDCKYLKYIHKLQ